MTSSFAATIDSGAGGANAAADLFAELLAIEHAARDEHRLTLLHWVLGLPFGLDPAAAAHAILDYQQTHPRPALSTALRDLLAVVGRCSRERLDGLSRHRRSFRTAARSD